MLDFKWIRFVLFFLKKKHLTRHILCLICYAVQAVFSKSFERMLKKKQFSFYTMLCMFRMHLDITSISKCVFKIFQNLVALSKS